jgi:amidophosphoribosyltransferase
VRFPNVYGIDMPSRDELLATGRTDEEICQEIGADALIYQDLKDLVGDVKLSNKAIEDFDCSCFDGKYVTGDVDAAYLNRIEAARGDMNIKQKPANASTQMDLNLIDSEFDDSELTADV